MRARIARSQEVRNDLDFLTLRLETRKGDEVVSVISPSAGSNGLYQMTHGLPRDFGYLSQLRKNKRHRERFGLE